MSFLQSALDLASKGFHVFPLAPGTKDQPTIADFPTLASRDPETIKAWWIDPILETEQPFNVGISTTKFGDDEALVVVDVDNKEGKNGDDELFKLELAGSELPATFEQRTPTGGRHLIFRTRKAVKQGTNVLGRGLDIRSRGGYVVGAGSHVERGTYSRVDCDRDRPLEWAPEWLLSRCGHSPERKKSAERTAHPGVDSSRAERRARHYLETEARTAVEGLSGDQTTFAVACRVKDFGLTEEQCFEIMQSVWNPHCEPPWDLEELKTKVANAYRYGIDAVGSDAPEVQFQTVVEGDGSKVSPFPDSFHPPQQLSQQPEPQQNYLHKINNDHALVYIEGSHCILNETVGEDGTPKRVFLTEASFKRKFSPFTVQQTAKGKPLTYAEVWLDWEHRRSYQGVCFAPEREPQNNYYNLWRGFSVKPLAYESANEKQKAGFDAFIDHARNNVCNGNEALFVWLMGYFAHMIQRPYERPLTTLVFKGKKGTGKNALIDRVGNLIGKSHYLVAHDSRYLTSNFNGHLDSCLCLVLDEAFWSGDKSAEGKLKGLTTAPTILIERKGKEPYSVDNLVRLIVIGNEQWLVPASADERRYAVFDLGENRMQDRKFFHDMRVNLDELGGSSVLLDYFKNFDLSQVDVDGAPVTDALLRQKEESLTLFEKWWLDCLTEGRLVSSDFGGEWPSTPVDRDRFRNAFKRYYGEHANRYTPAIPTDRAVGRYLKQCLPSLPGNTQRRDGTDLVKTYKLPDLSQARREWDLYMGHKGTWDQGSDIVNELTI